MNIIGCLVNVRVAIAGFSDWSCLYDCYAKQIENISYIYIFQIDIGKFVFFRLLLLCRS